MSLDFGGLMVFNNPIGSAKADQLVQLLELQSEDSALDAGCGTGEFLLRVLAEHPAHGIGVDRDSQCIVAAREGAAAMGLSLRCEFRIADVNELATEPGEFDLGICIGSTLGGGESQ